MMKLLSSLGKLKIFSHKGTNFSREDIIILSFVCFFLILIMLMVLDAYMFYAHVVKKENQAPSLIKPIQVTEDEINEIINALDEQEKKFNKVLNEKIATSTP